MRTSVPIASNRLFLICLAALSLGTANAEDAAVCARNLDPGVVKEILAANDSVQGKVDKVVVAAKANVVAGWGTLQRRGDIDAALSDTTRKLIAQLPSSIPEAELEKESSAIAASVSKALNAACAKPVVDMTELRATALKAAGLKEEPATPAAASPETPPEAAEIKSSGDALGTGDRLKFYTETDGFWLIKNSQPVAEAIAPCGAKFRVRDTDKSGENVLGYFYAVPTQTNDAKKLVRVGVLGKKCSADQISNRVEVGKDYQISTERLMRAPANVNGWQFGVLVAPYKFHFSDDSTTPAATVGGYFGFQFGSPAVNVTPVFSVGLGAVDETTPPVPAGEGEEEKPTGTLACLSAAGGVMFTIRKAGGFNVGLLLGSDWTGQKDRYRYDGKLWAAVTVGMALTK